MLDVILFTYHRETNNGCTDFDETLFFCSINAVFVLVKETAMVIHFCSYNGYGRESGSEAASRAVWGSWGTYYTG